MPETFSDVANHDDSSSTKAPQKHQNWGLLLLYCTCTAVGSIGFPFLQRLYYMQGGSLKWLSSFIQFIGFVILLPPLFCLYFKSKLPLNVFFMDFKLFLSSASIGILFGLDGYMYSAGLSYLPVSTSSLLASTSLAFTAFFAFLVVKQKFTFYTFNSVLIITFGALVLGLGTSSDRPAGVTQEKYLYGFFLTLGGAALAGFISPLIELAYRYTSKTIDWMMLLQVQVVINAFSALFCAIGMIISNDFKLIPNEAKDFSLGERMYYFILVASAIVGQLTFLGAVGIIMCKSSLFAGIFNSGLLPIIEVASVLTFHEKFTGGKVLSLALSLWGFTSYFIGEFKNSTKSNHVGEETIKDGFMDGQPDLEGQNHVEMVRVRV